jgi:hypothetical protein
MRKSKLMVIAAAIAVAGTFHAAAEAKREHREFLVMNEDVGVPVFPYDITDRPYEVVGEVETNVRKATIFSKSPSQKKIYEELWERAERMGADAVVNASYGDARVTLTSWGASKAHGTAVRFLPQTPNASSAR